MQKFISSLAALSLVAMTVFVGPVEAAVITNVSVDGGTAGTNLTASLATRVRVLATNPVAIPTGGTVTLTFASGFVATGVTSGDITLTASGAGVSGGSVVLANANGGTNNRITFTTSSAEIATSTAMIIDFNGTNKITTPAAGAYNTTITTSTNDFGAGLAYVGTINQVNVTATVDPILTFTLADYDAGGTNDANVNVQLGTVDTDASNAAEGTGVDGNVITVSTNAGSGISVNAADQALGLRTTTFAGTRNASTTDAQINDLTPAAAFPAANTEAFAYQVGINGAPAGNFNPLNGLTPVVLNNFITPIATGTGVVNVLYKAQTAPTTAAGSYSDVITYTVTPTF